MKNKLFTGIMPALVTPIHADGTLNAAAAEAVIDWELSHPITGFYINGATGEGPILPEATRRELAELAVAKVRGRGAIINHIGAPDTNEALRLARHAAEIGCDAISSVLPNFYFKYTTPQILDYYRRIGDASGLPIIVYANGLMNTDPVDFMRQAITLPCVAGVKYTIYDYYAMRLICELNGGDINVINGPDEMLLCGLVMGADGGIGTTYNIAPELFCELYRAYRAGELERAQEMQYRIVRMVEVVRRHGFSISTVKETLRMRGIDAGHAAYPAKVYDAAEAAVLRDELRALGIAGL